MYFYNNLYQKSFLEYFFIHNIAKMLVVIILNTVLCIILKKMIVLNIVLTVMLKKLHLIINN